MASTFLLQIVLLTLLTKDVNAKIGLIKADLGNQESQINSKGDVFCMDYHNNHAPLPPSYVFKTSIPVANYIFTQGCVEDDYKNIDDKIVAIDSGNCTYEEKAAIIQRLHGKAALIIMNENTSDILPIDSKYHDINITVVTMFFNDFVSLIALDSQVKIWFYTPEASHADPSLILFLCPVTIIVLASCWSASVQNKKTSHDRHSFKDGKEGKEVNKEIEDSVKDGKDCKVLNKEVEDSVEDGKDGKVLNKEIEDSVKGGKDGKEINKKIDDIVKDGKDCTVLNKEVEDSVKGGKDGKELNKKIEDSVKDGKDGKVLNKEIEDSVKDGKYGKVLNKVIEDSVKDGKDCTVLNKEVEDSVKGEKDGKVLNKEIEDNVKDGKDGKEIYKETEDIVKDGKDGKVLNKEIEDNVKDGKDGKEINKETEDSVKDGKDGKEINKETEDSVKDGQIGVNEGKMKRSKVRINSKDKNVVKEEGKKVADVKFVEEKKQKCWKMNLMKKKEKLIECWFMVAIPILLPVGGVAFGIYFIYKYAIIFLYIFCSYFVYIMITVFSLLGVKGIFNAFFPLWKKLLPCNERPLLRNFFLLLLAIGIVVAWIIVRNESSAWIFQDIIGFFICIQIICSIHLSNFKVCCVILFLFLVVDVFMVYISPICTNISIVAGANFSESQLIEKNPMIMILPYFTTLPLLECTNKHLYSGLGLMDIIIPGLVISHNCAFDLNIHNLLRRRCHFIYFISSTVAYVVGLLLAMTPAIIMGSIQPALLYIGPCIILTTVIIAAIRGDLGCMWRGDLKLDICHHVTSEIRHTDITVDDVCKQV